MKVLMKASISTGLKALAAVGAISLLSACGSQPVVEPIVSETQSWYYDCADGQGFTASLTGEQMTLFAFSGTVVLPQTQSASGNRYSDGENFIFTKGDDARAKVDGILYRNCVVNKSASIWEDAKLRGVSYRGLGNEPGWSIEIHGDRRAELVTNYGQTRQWLQLSEPSMDSESQTTVYQADKITVNVNGVPCKDTMSGQQFSSRVQVTGPELTLQGCGRALH